MAGIAWATFALVPGPAQALTLADFEHTAWVAKDGVEGGVMSIREAPSGMLRLGTGGATQVFDGLQFYSVPRQAPSPFADQAAVMGQTSPNGAVYFVDTVSGRLNRRWQGRTEPVEPLTAGSAWPEFTFDAEGTGWALQSGRLLRLTGLQIEVPDASWGLPAGMPLERLVTDAAGTLWASGQDDAIYHLPRGQRRFERFAPAGCAELAVAPDGNLWCTSAEGLWVVTVDQGRAVGSRQLSRRPSGAMLFDSRGGFWLQTLAGIEHAADWRQVLRPGGIKAMGTDAMTLKEGLSSDSIWTIQEDRAGQVWVGTGAGLERFRVTPFTPFRLPRRHFGAAMAADADGSLWVGNWDRGLMHLTHGRIDELPEIDGIQAIRRDPQGRIWVSANHSLWRKNQGGRFQRVGPISPNEMAEDDLGTVWSSESFRLRRLDNGQWTSPEGPTVPPADAWYILFADERRQLWFAGTGLYVRAGGQFRAHPSQAYADAVGHARASHVRGSRIWLGGDKGVGLLQQGEFRALAVKGDAVRQISGIVETAEGDLWLHGLTQAFRIPADQVSAGLRGQPAVAEVFGFRDGLQGVTGRAAPKPTLVEDTAGRLWFATDQGLFWIDPRARGKEALKPPVTLIRTVQHDDELMRAGEEAQLPPNPGRVEFGYTAASLAVSDRVHFRYRLVGIDKTWQEAGTSRTAAYTQLPPGRYRFEVMASDAQGDWAETASSLTLEVKPAWYQTLWFRALIALLLLALLWFLLRWRMLAAAARERARMREISAERERIARDLHDTLLQSMQGVILGFQALATAMPDQHETRRSIEARLDHADQLLGEARDRVRDLRSTGTDAVSLREAFELAAAELSGTARVEVCEEGTPRALRPLVRDRIYLIGREALLNAAMHGNGSAIQVLMQFGRRQFVLRVRDNGVGIDPGVLAAGSRPGHYGLVGMRERAAQLGAEFSLCRVAGGGTAAELQLPAARAFEAAPPALWQRFRRRWSLGAWRPLREARAPGPTPSFRASRR